MRSCVLVAAVLMSCCPARAQPLSNETTAPFEQWGTETLANIRRDLWIEDRQLYAEEAHAGIKPIKPAFMWGAGVQLSALAAAARIDPERYAAPLTQYADALQEYWVVDRGVGGYDVLPSSPNVDRDVDRYYDDNAWIVLAMIEAFDVTGKRKYLDRAEETMRFVLSGEDDHLGGGIYWRENRRRSKNTCSNAPTIVAALRLHQRTDDPQHLATAERLYAWTQSRLQDEQDHLYWDNIRRRGRIDRRKFSYNSALMIRANCLMHEVKHEVKYLAEAQRMAESAARHWIVAETGAVKDTGKFAHMLLESLLAVDRQTGRTNWREVVLKSVAFVHDQVADANGRYPSRWDAPTAEPLESFQLIDQASAARAYFVAADLPPPDE
jgi:mannose/cellobiose epimerase-like protein (N-acyl-D-glucosamine 2-epimerase family)